MGISGNTQGYIIYYTQTSAGIYKSLAPSHHGIFYVSEQRFLVHAGYTSAL